MKDVILIVEGGGNRLLDADLRTAVDHFVAEAKAKVRASRKRWRTILGYGRDDAYQEFLEKSRSHPETLVLLLVDSETARAYLPPKWLSRDLLEDRLFFMVQCMEAWIVADRKRLVEHFVGFRESALPQRPPEESSPEQLRRALEVATKDCGFGPYEKKHGPMLLAKVRPEVVAERCPSARTFVDSLDALLT